MLRLIINPKEEALKKEIKKALVDDYHLDERKADNLLKKELVDAVIFHIDNLDWSREQGADYWALQIYDAFVKTNME